MQGLRARLEHTAVREIMTPDVLTVDPETPIEQVISLLNQHGLSGMPVADEDGHLLGMITDLSLLNRVLRDVDIESQTVGSLMSRQVICVDENDRTIELVEKLVEHRVNRVPVVRRGKIIGLVSRTDLMRFLGGVHSEMSRFLPAAPAQRHLPNNSSRPTILIVDDSAVIHEVMRDALARADYHLEFCFSGEDALARFDKVAPDLVLLDRLMPGLDGLAVLRRLSENAETADVPVIMVTACDRSANVAEALNAGAVDYVNKPVSAIELQARVASALRAHFLQRELEVERTKAERAANAKSDFLANMSHEIRTPMTAILGFADVLVDNLSKPDDVSAIDTIRRNGRHLLELVNDILDVSKFESGQMQVESVPTMLVELIEDVLQLMRPRAEEKGLYLRVVNSPDTPDGVYTDPTRLRQILLNLLGNAIKFTESGGVELRVSHETPTRSAPRLRFDIRDTGVGMTADTLARLFQPFSQGETSTTRKFGGTGLGLTISKRLANLLGGDVTVVSEYGEGSTFTATIAARIATYDSLKHDTDSTNASSEKQQVGILPKLQDVRVLLAEDGPDNQRLISFLLRKAGAAVTVVDNGEVAVQAVLGASFDIILMDMQMPVMDGYSAVRTLREKGCSTPIVALTAYAQEADRRKCLATGCTDFLTKPIDRPALLEVVARCALLSNASKSTSAEAEHPSEASSG